MKKDIYIVKNDLNNKVYIGQATDTAERWRRHIYDAKYEFKYNKNISILHKEMMEFGIQHFYYQILEYQIDNFNKMEMYYIKYYNSLTPNGYNIACGGLGTGKGIESVNSIFKSNEEINDIIYEISSSNKTFENIARKYNCSQEVIHAINVGERYKREDLVYPLRSNKYTQEKIKQVVYALKYEKDKTLIQISKEYEIDLSQLSEINQGRIYMIKNQKYPLRSGKITNLSDKELSEIIDLLYDEDVSQKDIAIKFNISKSMVTSINKGLSYFKPNINYPIRNNYQRRVTKDCFIEPNILRNIEGELIYSNKSMRKIASEYNLTFTTLLNINRGTIKKYKNNNIKYPIRK